MFLKFLESVALFIVKPNIYLGSFFVQMMTQIPYLQRWILFFVFYIFENPHILLCFGHISTNERPDASFQVPLLHLMMFDVSTVCKYFGTVVLSKLNISSRKSEIVHQLPVIFQTSSLSNCPFFHLPGGIFTFLNFFLNFFLLRKALSMRKALSIKQHIKASVGTRKFLSEFCLKCSQLNLILSFYCLWVLRVFLVSKSIIFVMIYLLWHKTCH